VELNYVDKKLDIVYNQTSQYKYSLPKSF